MNDSSTTTLNQGDLIPGGKGKGTGTGANTSEASQSKTEKVKAKSDTGKAKDSDMVASVRSSAKPVSEKQEKKRSIKSSKKASKKRKLDSSRRAEGAQEVHDDEYAIKKPGPKKGKKKKGSDDGGKVKKKKKPDKLSPAQTAMNDMMHHVLQDDKYSDIGSIVDIDDSADEEDPRAIYAITGGAASSKRGMYSNNDDGQLLKLDRSVIVKAARKRIYIEGIRRVMDTTGSRKRANSVVIVEDKEGGNALSSMGDLSGDDASVARGGRKKKRKKNKRVSRSDVDDADFGDDHSKVTTSTSGPDGPTCTLTDDMQDVGADESSIYGLPPGSSNATWVECDKCKKWRRLRGIVDAKKLPPKWFCSMNKTDPERAKCSAPEEEYETPATPETLNDQRARKHLRLWVRRLQCNENYESRLPTMTRGKRRNTTSAKDPYEWVRCCNPSCGKWRAVLRSMDASSVIDAAKNGKWYCVLNTWDEKTASCAAPQENLPAIGCPAWVLHDED